MTSVVEFGCVGACFFFLFSSQLLTVPCSGRQRALRDALVERANKNLATGTSKAFRYPQATLMDLRAYDYFIISYLLGGA